MIRLVQQNGGVLNGSTRFDFTNYYEVMPANTLETMLWAEADRMRGLDITEENLTNQKGVVSNEVKVNVINTSVRWLSLARHATVRQHQLVQRAQLLRRPEGHRSGDACLTSSTSSPPTTRPTMQRWLWSAISRSTRRRHGCSNTSATYPRARFHRCLTYPNPSRQRRSTPPKSTNWRANRHWPFLITCPSGAPKTGTPWASSTRSCCRATTVCSVQEIVKNRGFASAVDGGVNQLGNLYDYRGPMLFTGSLIHDDSVTSAQIMSAVDGVMQRVIDQPVDAATLRRAQTKLISDLYDQEGNLGLGKVDLLACFALFDDDPDANQHAGGKLQ